MEASIYLARVLGLISAISAGAVMLRYTESMKLEEEAVKNSSFTYTSGFVIMIMGVLLIVAHSVWVTDWRLIITLFGWLVFFKGIGRILFPRGVRRMIEKKKVNRKFILGEIVLFLVGLYLLYIGFVVY